MKNPTQYHVIDGYKGNDHWFMPKVPETATKIFLEFVFLIVLLVLTTI